MINKQAEHWNKHAEIFDKVLLNYRDYNRLVNKHVTALSKRKIILDIGAGTGNVTHELLKKDLKVYAIDISEESIKILKEKCKEYSHNLIAEVKDGKILKFSNNFFEGINSMQVLQYVEDPITHLKEVYRVLKDGGALALTTNNPNYRNNFKKFFEDVRQHTRGVINQEDLERYIKEAICSIETKAINWFNPKELEKILLDIGFNKVSKPIYFGKKVSYFIKVIK